MKIVDLTQTIMEEMPVYPGTEGPKLRKACTLEADGFIETKLCFFSHTGTHMDSPSHLIEGGKTLDTFGSEYFYGTGMVLEVSGTDSITLSHLEPFSKVIKELTFLLIHTGWAEKWGQQDYFHGYPVFTPEAAQWLAGSGIKVIGVDTISVDPVGITELPIHRILLGNNVLIIENLTNLKELTGKAVTVCCLPLKLYRADGAPVRAIAIE